MRPREGVVGRPAMRPPPDAFRDLVASDAPPQPQPQPQQHSKVGGGPIWRPRLSTPDPFRPASATASAPVLYDIVLWRKVYHSTAVLVASTGVWMLFKWCDCHLIPMVSMGSLIILALLFLWSNTMHFLNRSPPPMQKVNLSEEVAFRAAKEFRSIINQLVTILHEVVIQRDVKLFLKVELGLWLLSLIGVWLDFLTILYLSIVFMMTVPIMYLKHKEEVDYVAQRAMEKYKLTNMNFRESFFKKYNAMKDQKETYIQSKVR